MKQPKWINEGRDSTREIVRKRDNHTCQKCGKKWKKGMRRFDIHHLKGWCGKKSLAYDRRIDMNKLITLCHKCHLNLPEVRKKMGITQKQDKRDKLIIKLYAGGNGLTMDEIVSIMHYGKHTVLNAIHFKSKVAKRKK